MRHLFHPAPFKVVDLHAYKVGLGQGRVVKRNVETVWLGN